jgi:hypothetical protein
MSPSNMQKSHLLRLPVELHQEICNHVRRPKDRSRLSKTCRLYHELLLPSLMGTVYLTNRIRNADSVRILSQSPNRDHVRSLHYVGVLDEWYEAAYMTSREETANPLQGRRPG